MQKKPKNILSYLRLGISSKDSFHEVNLNPTTINKGYKTLIKVKPTSVISDENIKSLDIDQRRCRFEEEVPEDMVLFKKYTPSACRFECVFKFRYICINFV